MNQNSIKFYTKVDELYIQDLMLKNTWFDQQPAVPMQQWSQDVLQGVLFIFNYYVFNAFGFLILICNL